MNVNVTQKGHAHLCAKKKIKLNFVLYDTWKHNRFFESQTILSAKTQDCKTITYELSSFYFLSVVVALHNVQVYHNKPFFK